MVIVNVPDQARTIPPVVYNFIILYVPTIIQLLLELEIKHKHDGFNINYEKATVVWQQFGSGS
jgi:hypothetical protein